MYIVSKGRGAGGGCVASTARIRYNMERRVAGECRPQQMDIILLVSNAVQERIDWRLQPLYTERRVAALPHTAAPLDNCTLQLPRVLLDCRTLPHALSNTATHCRTVLRTLPHTAAHTATHCRTLPHCRTAVQYRCAHCRIAAHCRVHCHILSSAQSCALCAHYRAHFSVSSALAQRIHSVP
jgi:hypothetical protein